MAKVDLPHDWAIAGPFQDGSDSEVEAEWAVCQVMV